MKKGLLLFVMCLFVLSACAAKPYSLDTQKQEELDLVKELQDIERELDEKNVSAEDDNTSVVDEQNVSDGLTGAAVTEDVVVEESSTDIEATEDTSQLERLEYLETDLVNLRVEAEDKDEDPVLYTFSAPLTENGTWQTNYGDAGEYVVSVVASDGENNAEQKVLLVVNKKNVPPTIEGVPAKLAVKEGESIELEPQVSDPNRDSFTIRYSTPLDETGRWVTDHTSAGEYEITVTASDGEAESQSLLLLSVEDINVPPTISGIESTLSVKEGETVIVKPEVSDLDNDKIELSISEPVGDDGEWATDYTSHGTYTITVTVSDGKDTVSKEVELTIEDVNVPPRIIAIRQG